MNSIEDLIEMVEQDGKLEFCKNYKRFIEMFLPPMENSQSLEDMLRDGIKPIYRWIENPSKVLKAGDTVIIEGSQRIWKIDTCNPDGFHATSHIYPVRKCIIVYMNNDRIRAAHQDEIQNGVAHD